MSPKPFTRSEFNAPSPVSMLAEYKARKKASVLFSMMPLLNTYGAIMEEDRQPGPPLISVRMRRDCRECGFFRTSHGSVVKGFGA
jgi:hypothetical protein